LHDSLVSCLNLATLTEDRIDKTIGHLSAALMQRVDQALRTALGLP
jgi:mRNA-degrading endonuclease toxin of MazEF toxin-antitoxin module